VWKLLSKIPPTYDCTLASHGTHFVNSLAFVSPSSNYPDGLIISGGQDAIIELRRPGASPRDNAEALLLGHQGNVCSLDVSEDGKTFVSGSWDSDARVWQLGKMEATSVLQGHEANVWTVLWYDRETIITGELHTVYRDTIVRRFLANTTVMTGCADKLIRVFHPAGKLRRTIRGSTDVVRALCKLPANHPSGAQFASAGNDATIRLWTLEGVEVAQLHGHESFIYSLASLPSGEVASSSEDRTVRIWKGDQCVQTITHPAISVWSVAVCADNGDIVTGASDRIVRIFSRSKDRQAPASILQAFEESVKASAIPQQAVGNINKHDLPGPEFLQQKSGTKEGQVQMIKESNGSVSAYQWSNAASQWVNVGTVVDVAGGSGGRKITYNGKDYDYVFDVDIEDGKPPLKLPYNATQNPYEVARKFISDNELPLSYMDQVANFIISNTQGTAIGEQQTALPGSDPWGTESRYRPGDVDVAPGPTASAKPRVLPQTQYLAISTAQYRTIQKKLEEFNQQLIADGRKDISLNPSGLETLAATIKQLEAASGKPDDSIPLLPEGVDVVTKVITSWPVDKRLPGYDLLRIMAAASNITVSRTSSGGKTIVDILAASDVFSPEAPINSTMLAVRAMANLFMNSDGRTIMDGEWEKVHALIKPFITTKNRNLIVAITTLYINYTVLLTAGGDSHDVNRATTLLDELITITNLATDAEALYRALVGVGTLLSLGQDFRDMVKDALDIGKALTRAEKQGIEPRIKTVVKEIRSLLS
jgi:phospholipase A-2-activating protein